MERHGQVQGRKKLGWFALTLAAVSFAGMGVAAASPRYDGGGAGGGYDDSAPIVRSHDSSWGRGDAQRADELRREEARRLEEQRVAERREAERRAAEERRIEEARRAEARREEALRIEEQRREEQRRDSDRRWGNHDNDDRPQARDHSARHARDDRGSNRRGR